MYPKSKIARFITTYIFKILLLLILVTIGIGSVQAAEIPDPDTDNHTSIDSSSTKSESPDYDVVFPDDKVQRIDIKISSENWQKMLDNMTELYGPFGNHTQIPISAVNFTPGEKPGGLGMPGMTDTNPVYVPARVTLNGTTLDNVGIRFKGFSSLSGSWSEGTYKISLKLDCDQFKDEYSQVKGQSLFGFDKLNLQSGYSDNSLMKDKVVTEIFRDAGVPAPRASYYQVFIDKGNGPEYFGLYTMIEDVGDTMISSQFADDTGNLYKANGERDATFQEGTFNSSFFKKETNKKENDYSDLEQLYDTLNSEKRATDPTVWRSDLESIFDVDEFLTWLAINTVIQNWDTYGSMAHNFYLYINPSTGQITWIPWDNNLALQNGSEGLGGMGGGRPEFGNVSAENISSNLITIPFREQMNGFGNSTFRDLDIPVGMGGGRPESGNVAAENISSNLITIPFREQMNGFGNFSMGMHGGMGGPGGGTQDISLANVTGDWPLIRYLMYDPVYHENYVNAVAAVISDVFNPDRMDPIYTRNHDLISPYVIGENGEQEGYTHLKNPEDFIDSLDSLITHTKSRYEAAQKFLNEQEEA